MPGWQFWVDRGGTFTDVVALSDDGRQVVVEKLLSESDAYADAAVEGIRRITGDSQVLGVRMGTTVATNALLTRAGSPTALVVTSGFEDALRIGFQNRPDIFAREIVLPRPLYSGVIGYRERVTAGGTVLREADLDALAADLRSAYDGGLRSVAIVCIHGHRFPTHEQQAAEIARSIGFTQISLSSETSPLTKLVPRGDTTVVDAYLSPVLRTYVERVTRELAGVPVMFMQSNGGLVEAHHFRGKDALLSGPAGGTVGMVRLSQLAGYDKVIGFDMGGTSTDVSHFAGELERVFDTTVAGVRVRAPMLSIHTVAAGGGSILHFDGSRYRVGPDSAGADPGPAAYRRGGPLTVTDANVMLGRIQPDHFPRVFGRGDEPIDVDHVRRKFADLAEQIRDAIGDSRTPEQVAAGYVQIAVANMANAVKRISVQRGHDVSAYALTTFGGAGGQHACAVADALGIRTVLVPPLAGVLSAVGMGLADTTSMREQSVEVPLADTATLDEVVAQLRATTVAALLEQGVPEERIRVVARVLVRYDGTDTTVPVELADPDVMAAAFERGHRRTYGFLLDRPLVADSVSVEAAGAAGHGLAADLSMLTGPTGRAAVPPTPVRMHCEDGWRTVPLFRRESLGPSEVVGPAIVVEPSSTTVVDEGWMARLSPHGHLVLQRSTPVGGHAQLGTAADPVRLELFNNLFMSVAEQMGARLSATAQSVNIKERLDFSCALFDPSGDLIANAPHMPVHLGSMGASIREVARRNAGRMRPGDAYAINDPYHGGTHLPDVTVVTPVFDADGQTVLFFVASRGHHAEIGGITPGSMPAFSTTIEEEGILFDNWQLVSQGRLREAETRELLTSGPFPSRAPDVNMADLRAQIAANAKGVEEVGRMIDHFGLDVVQAYMAHVQDNAEEAVRRVLATLRDGAWSYEMDDGSRIEVAIRVDRAARSATIDFTGTSEQVATNFNAPGSVATAAVLYVFRTLVADDIPLNDGCLRPLTVIVPEGSILAPTYPAATVAGNVETSQAVTGALYGALGIQAEGSGTMNNVTFGNERHQYYETVASGSGAGDGFDGADVVQTHMTNSRLTDPEVLESRFPAMVESFAVRVGSGGDGRWRGGDGAVRRLRFTEPMTVSLLSSHRRVPPYGMAGGLTGALGRNHVERVAGVIVDLGGCAAVTVAPGDVLVVSTPGGGGFGPPGTASVE